jgi:hypothetical protein
MNQYGMTDTETLFPKKLKLLSFVDATQSTELPAAVTYSYNPATYKLVFQTDKLIVRLRVTKMIYNVCSTESGPTNVQSHRRIQRPQSKSSP